MLSARLPPGKEPEPPKHSSPWAKDTAASAAAPAQVTDPTHTPGSWGSHPPPRGAAVLTGGRGGAVSADGQLVLDASQCAGRREPPQHVGEEEGVGGHGVTVEVPPPGRGAGAAVAGHGGGLRCRGGVSGVGCGGRAEHGAPQVTRCPAAVLAGGTGSCDTAGGAESVVSRRAGTPGPHPDVASTTRASVSPAPPPRGCIPSRPQEGAAGRAQRSPPGSQQSPRLTTPRPAGPAGAGH